MVEELSPEQRAAVLAGLKAWSELPEDERNGERPYIMGFNAGWEAHAEQASPPLPADTAGLVERLRAVAPIQLELERNIYQIKNQLERGDAPLPSATEIEQLLLEAATALEALVLRVGRLEGALGKIANTPYSSWKSQEIARTALADGGLDV